MQRCCARWLLLAEARFITHEEETSPLLRATRPTLFPKGQPPSLKPSIPGYSNPHNLTLTSSYASAMLVPPSSSRPHQCAFMAVLPSPCSVLAPVFRSWEGYVWRQGLP
jgi:hypothetical protein